MLKKPPFTPRKTKPSSPSAPLHPRYPLKATVFGLLAIVTVSCSDQSTDSNANQQETEFTFTEQPMGNQATAQQATDPDNPTDEQLTAQAQTLLEEEGIEDVAVQFIDGHATIRGRGLSASVETEVLAIVREMTGVKSVLGKFQQIETSQADIDAKLYSHAQQLLAEQNITGIDVDVENRIANLSGDFPGLETAQQAANTVASLDGISRVTMQFTKADGTTIRDAEIENTALCKTQVFDQLQEEKINFESGSSRLTAESKTLVKRLAESLAQCSTATIALTGHTDSSGSASINKKLSGLRAEAVAKALIDAGIADSRISTAGVGSSRPIASNDTADGRAQNRRIEFSLDL